MARRASLLLLGFTALLVAPRSSRAQVLLTPAYSPSLPAGHSYVIGVASPYRTTDSSPTPRITLHTTNETYETPTSAVTGFQTIYQINQLGSILGEESLAVSNTRDHTIFLGGDIEAVTVRRTPSGIESARAIGSFVNLPTGLTLTGATSTSGPMAAFMSAAAGTSTGDTTPSLAYTLDIGPFGTGSISVQVFGNSGAGAVSSSVGALAVGPDGVLHVLDVGRGSILRYNATTLAYIESLALSGSNTDRNGLVITDNGYIFTAFTDAAGGNIYDYTTGTLVGTYSAGTLSAGNGNGGKTGLAYDAELDLVLAYFNVNGAEGAFIFDSTQLSAVPEPSTYAMFAGLGVLALAVWRRRRAGNRQ